MTNEEKIRKDLSDKAGKIFTDYNLLKTSGDNQPPGLALESSHKSSKPGCLKVVLVILGFIALMLIARMIDRSDIFQKTVNPQKYWRTQVATLEENIYETQLYIKDWEDSSSKKNKISVNYDLLVRKLIIEGKEPKEAKQIASDMIKEMDKAEKETDATMIKVREQMLEHSYKSLDDYKRQLEQAKKELAKHQ